VAAVIGHVAAIVQDDTPAQYSPNQQSVLDIDARAGIQLCFRQFSNGDKIIKI
jgi:hypothetical protein